MTEKSTAKKVSFEKSISKLESILEKLEQGDLPLEKSLKLFQEGMTLSAQCADLLNQAEQSVKLIHIQENGECTEDIFEPLDKEDPQ